MQKITQNTVTERAPLMFSDRSDLGSLILIQITPKECTLYKFDAYQRGGQGSRGMFIFHRYVRGCPQSRTHKTH